MVLAAGMLVAAGALGRSSLYVAGIALLILAVGATAWAWLAARGVRIERSVGPPTIVEGDPYPIRVAVRHGIIPPRGELLDPILARPLPVRALGGGGRRRDAVHRGEARFESRGRQPLGRIRMVIRDPFGLAASEVEGPPSGEVLVLPRIEPVAADGGGPGDGVDILAGSGEAGGASGRGGAGIEIQGLRPYRKGSAASRIHWPAVARHGELIERQLASGGEGRALVVLDGEAPAGPEALDQAVRAAASLCVHLARAGGCMLLVPGSARPLGIDAQMRGWAKAHARLALAEPGRAAAGAAAADAARTFWVTAAKPPRLPRRLRAGSYLVTPFPSEAARATFTVAGCHGVPVGAQGRAQRAIASVT